MVNHYAVPPSEPGGTRHHALAKGLLTYGWNATIFASSVNHQSGHNRLSSNERSRSDLIDGINFVSIVADNAKHRRREAGRVMGMVRFAYQVATADVVEYGEALKADVVIGSSVHPLAALAGWVVARRLGVPFIFEVRDLWPESLVAMGRLGRRSPAAVLLYGLERFLFNRATFVISPLPRIAHYARERLGSDSRFRVIHNGIDVDWFEAMCDRPSPLPSPTSSFTVMYAGAMGTANALPVVLDGYRMFRDAHPGVSAELRLVGDGPMRKGLEAKVREEGISGVAFFDSVAKDHVPALLQQADVLVISVANQPELYRYGICMNKFFDYLASGKPTLSASGADTDPIALSGGGIRVQPGDAAAISDGLRKLFMSTPEERRDIGLLAKAYVRRHHDFKAIAEDLAHVLNAACKRGVT